MFSEPMPTMIELGSSSSSPTPLPASAEDMADEYPSFDSYCIVCDRLIVPPKEKEVEDVVKPKKKPAAGAIRIKNPDGSTTTRTANGTKTTRPGLRRNPNSANRLAAVAAANNNAAAKLQPLTRSKTADPPPTTACPAAECGSTPKPAPTHTSPPSAPREPPFRSSIYCSQSCALADGKSSEAFKTLARTMSSDFSSPPLDHAHHPHQMQINTNLGYVNPYAPPSPLFISGSDTESSAASIPPDVSGPACSAPKTLEYFRMSREGPDDAWREIQRQRRSSMQPGMSHPRPTDMARMPSTTSTRHEASSDSLSSMWNPHGMSEELYLARSISGGGALRGMTPVHPAQPEGQGQGRRSMSSSSDRSTAPTGLAFARPTLPRSNLSQTSLAGSPSSHASPIPIAAHGTPADVSLASSHTLSLLQSYAHAFPSSSASSYGQQRALASESYSSRPTSSRGNTTGACSLSRPSAGSGTIKAKPPTWDAFGKEALAEKRSRGRSTATATTSPRYDLEIISPDSRPAAGQDRTPKQSLDVKDGQWKITYVVPRTSRSVSSARSTTSGSDVDSDDHSFPADHVSRLRALPIPSRSVATPNRLSTSTSTAGGAGRTPLGGVGSMPPPPTVPSRPASAMPDLETLHLGSAAGQQDETARPGTSATRSGFNWEKLERAGGMTYELPKGMKIDRSKAGLFYFQ